MDRMSISENVYKRLFISFCLSGCLMLLLIYSMALANSILLDKDIFGQVFAIVIIVGLPIAIASTMDMGAVSTTRIAVGCLVLLLLDVVGMAVFLARFDVNNFSIYAMSDFYTMVFVFFATLTMVVAKIFVK